MGILKWLIFLLNRKIRTVIIALIAIVFIQTACTSSTIQGTAEQLIHQVIEEYDRTILRTSYVSPAAYMEKAKCSGEYCMYTEAEGFIHSFGYDYEIQTGNFVFLPANLKKSDRKLPWLKTLENWYADVPNITHRSDLPPGYGSLFSAFRWFEIHGPLGDPRSFNYEITDTLEASNSDISLIQLEFKPAGGREYAGTFYINSETLSVHSVQLEQVLFHSSNFRQWVSANGEFSWHMENSFSSLSSAKLAYTKDSIEYWIELEVSPQFILDPNMDENELQAITFSDINPFITYQADEWSPSSPFSNVYMDSVKRYLEGEKTLEEQFQANAGQSFYINTYHNGNKFTVTGEEETYKLVEQIINRLNQEFK